jgi:hypothetical protein
VASAVGTRWFRDAGGMPPLTLVPVSGRYLSFAEREEIAILHAQQLGDTIGVLDAAVDHLGRAGSYRSVLNNSLVTSRSSCQFPEMSISSGPASLIPHVGRRLRLGQAL